MTVEQLIGLLKRYDKDSFVIIGTERILVEVSQGRFVNIEKDPGPCKSNTETQS